MGERSARALVYQRSGGLCEMCCRQPAREWHHRKNRSQGGLWLPSNGLHLCSNCHGRVTNTNGRRDHYEARGWIVPSWRDPHDVSVFLLGAGGWFLLDDEGNRHAC